MPAKIRIGVTGSGFMGRTHVDAARRLESTEIVAVSGGSRAPQLAADYGIDCEPDTPSLVARPDIDAIVITTPHHVHCEEALWAAEAGKHALVEKPLATSLEDCDRMQAAFTDRQLVLSVGYHQRFRESIKRTRQLLTEGSIGTVRCLQTSALFDITAMRDDEGFGGNWSWWKDPRSLAHLINGAPHTVDLVRWWLDTEIDTIAAHCNTFREENPNENTTMSLISFQDGTSCTYWSSSVLPDPGFPQESFRFRFMGDDGLLDLDPYGKLQLALNGHWETVYEQPPVGFDQADAAYQAPRMQAYCDQMQAFVNSIHGQPGGEGTAADGRAGVAAVLAMLEASNQRKTITL
ncbi:MAG: Gfo/Idh/MocA family oxidoreductase [Planctomycetota bacterium]|nr:Gfo/Idh/MocA family oxidoreductase [Planctomycetota bacterium]